MLALGDEDEDEDEGVDRRELSVSGLGADDALADVEDVVAVVGGVAAAVLVVVEVLATVVVADECGCGCKDAGVDGKWEAR